MRVIAGQYKGARLYAPKGKWLRPTSDRVKEYIFSVLGDSVIDAVVFDLFAGSGSLGIEALSRGAVQAVFVDQSDISAANIRRNLEKLGIVAQVYHKPVFAFFKVAEQIKIRANIIFCDPPYDFADFGLVLAGIKKAGVLESGGCVIYESSARRPVPELLKIERQKKLGDTMITFYESDQQ